MVSITMIINVSTGVVEGSQKVKECVFVSLRE